MNNPAGLFSTPKKKALVISVSLSILFVILAFTLVKVGFFSYIGFLFSPRGEVLVGTIPIEDGLQDVQEIPKGEIRFRLNKTVTFKDGHSMGDIMLENPKACEFDLEFSFYTLDSELIYVSPRLKPGEYINNDKLKKRLKKGVYECVYKATAYEEGARMGDAGGYLTITVES